MLIIIEDFNSVIEAKIFIAKYGIKQLEREIKICSIADLTFTENTEKYQSMKKEIEKTEKWLKNKISKYPQYFL
jgi:hypothetical protein